MINLSLQRSILKLRLQSQILTESFAQVKEEYWKSNETIYKFKIMSILEDILGDIFCDPDTVIPTIFSKAETVEK